jgi:uroporphyrinogen decarboxylase
VTGYERFANALAREPVDMLPAVINPWEATVKRWKDEGHIAQDEDVSEHFDVDMVMTGLLDSCADLDFVPRTLEETDETILQIDGNGAMLRRHKLHDSTPEHVDFTVKDCSGWEETIKPRLLDVDRRRIPFEDYRDVKAAAGQRFFCCVGTAPFEQMHRMCGHENMLVGMALDPDWVRDMVNTYAEFTIMHLETLFAEEGKPDGMFFYEDMGFKNKPFMSPSMYEEIMLPGHKKLFDYAHSMGCKVIVHSCGYVEPLVPGLIEAGMDCLQAMEVKAGMDLPHIYERFGDRIAFFGGLDVRTLVANDRAAIDVELEKKIVPVVKGGGGYILHTDHSEPPEVDYDTMRYFIDRGREIAKAAGLHDPGRCRQR